MRRVRFADRVIEWDRGDLPIDPLSVALPLLHDELPDAPDAASSATIADLSIRARLSAEPTPSPATYGGTPVLYQNVTRCFATAEGLTVWDGASTIRISADGRAMAADIHASSLEHPFQFLAVTMKMAMLLALRGHGLFHLHAAAVRWPEGDTWVIPGESGAGKSTLTLAFLQAGAHWLSDDALLVPSGERAEVIAWSRKIRMTAQTTAAHPELAPLLRRCAPGSGRDFEVDPQQAFPGRGVLRAGPPLTLLFPRIVDGEASELLPLSRNEAFGRILLACPWVAATQLARREEQLAALARIVDGARVFELAAGTGLLQAPEAAARALRRSGA
jgi:hypothetical protein